MKHAKDFTAEEKRVVRERARFQSAKELAAVFCTSPRVITNICRYV